MGPLEGIKVLDLSRYGPGRYCSMIMADFGAEVITVETPRNAGELPGIVTDDTGARYLCQNRNKRSIALNLKKEEGKKIFLRMAEWADVMLETYRPGVVKRLGVDYETISRINPGVIYCSITGYGQDGPYAQRAGHDLNYAALGGAVGLFGPQDGPPIYPPYEIADLAGGTSHAAIAILSAVISRQKTGKGQYIDVSMTDGIVFYLWTHAQQYLLDGKSPERGHLPTGSDMAWNNIYKAGDGKYFAVGCVETWLWANLCRLVGREDFIPAQFGPFEKQSEMYRELSRIFLTKDRDRWVDLLDEADVCVSPVCTLEETFADPQIKHRKLVTEVNHPKLGKLKILNSPYKFSGTPAEIRTPPALYAQHTDEVLTSMLGYGVKDLERLRKDGAIE